MRKELNIFVDPNTRRPLSLKIEESKSGHVTSGTLFCGKRNYPIAKGIPRFVDKSFYCRKGPYAYEQQTSWSFSNKWREKRSRRLGAMSQDVKSLKEQFMAVLGCHTAAELKNILNNAGRTLNAGCGVAWSEYLFNYNPETERHCIDLSLSVEVAYRRTRNFKNIVISQASIFELPYADNTFDIAYSIGVLHHTPDPKKALRALVKKVKAGGLMGVYVYNKKPPIREAADREIRKITAEMSYEECMKFSAKMTKLGMALSRIKQPLILKEDIDLLGVEKGKYNIQRFIYDYFLKCWFNQKWDIKYADLVNQDWYHPYYASHHTKEEIINWFQEAGVKSIKCIQPKGWEWSGFFVSGRKNNE